MVYKRQSKEIENNLNNLIDKRLTEKGLTDVKIQSLINWRITIEPEDTKLKDFIRQVLKNNKILS